MKYYLRWKKERITNRQIENYLHAFRNDVKGVGRNQYKEENKVGQEYETA
ncbi:MAG: hypothetical protein HY831_04490 [Candidatus Aenigmarchaeota archaeon]|nr:hypothetical protein [Candidatus Aenigmarchaeota archaeon]